jgi:cysteine desulfurase/selenocysteine lyase
MGFDIQKIRKQFQILDQKINGYPLVYFDNAATSQKPRVVVETIEDYYFRYNANIHRGVHSLSQTATNQYEEARQTLQNHFHAKHAHEILFTTGTTGSINLVASCFASFLKEDDEIIISTLEHHSNIVPWQMLCKRTGAKLKVIPITQEGELQMEAYDKLLSSKTKMVAVAHISNTLGTVNPVQEIIAKAHQVGAAVLLDGAQAGLHVKPDLQKLNVDFYAISAHKMCGPTGVGMLYGKEAWLEKLPPYQGGGEMIKQVTFKETTFADLPYKFEAGTPNISGGIAFATAIDFINNLGIENIAKYENELLEYATQKLVAIDGVTIFGTAKNKAAVLSFNIENCHPYDVGMILDKLGIAVRTGHHCTQPLMDFYKIPGTVRASFAFYNTKEEIDVFIEGVQKAKMMLS